MLQPCWPEGGDQPRLRTCPRPPAQRVGRRSTLGPGRSLTRGGAPKCLVVSMPSALTFIFNFVSQQNDQLEQSTEHLSGCGVVLSAFLDRWTFVDEGRFESGSNRAVSRAASSLV